MVVMELGRGRQAQLSGPQAELCVQPTRIVAQHPQALGQLFEAQMRIVAYRRCRDRDDIEVERRIVLQARHFDQGEAEHLVEPASEFFRLREDRPPWRPARASSFNARASRKVTSG